MPDDDKDKDLVEVDLFDGVKIKLPKADAEKAIAGRDNIKKDRQRFADEAGRARAEKEAAEANARKASEEKATLEAAKAGEIEKVKEIVTKDLKTELGRLRDKLKLDGLKSAIASNPNIVTTAIPDVMEQLKGRVAYDPNLGELVALDEAGQPAKDPQSGNSVKMDVFINGFLEKRPHFLRDTTPAGSGAAEGRKQTLTTATISRADYDKASLTRDSKVMQQIAAGKIRVID